MRTEDHGDAMVRIQLKTLLTFWSHMPATVQLVLKNDDSEHVKGMGREKTLELGDDARCWVYLDAHQERLKLWNAMTRELYHDSFMSRNI